MSVFCAGQTQKDSLPFFPRVSLDEDLIHSFYVLSLTLNRTLISAFTFTLIKLLLVIWIALCLLSVQELVGSCASSERSLHNSCHEWMRCHAYVNIFTQVAGVLCECCTSYTSVAVTVLQHTLDAMERPYLIYLIFILFNINVNHWMPISWFAFTNLLHLLYKSLAQEIQIQFTFLVYKVPAESKSKPSFLAVGNK